MLIDGIMDAAREVARVEVVGVGDVVNARTLDTGMTGE